VYPFLAFFRSMPEALVPYFLMVFLWIIVPIVLMQNHLGKKPKLPAFAGNGNDGIHPP